MPRQIDSHRQLLNFRRGFDAGKRVLARIGAAAWSRSFHGGGDLALGGVGFTLAGLSLLFAAEMLRKPHEPYIRGLQYFAIFAQPNSSALKAAQQASAPPKKSNGVDYTSTASISERNRQRTAEEEAAELTGYEILGATNEAAWLKRGSEIGEVHVGDYVPGVGKILAIELQAGRWRLVGEDSSLPLEKESSEEPGRGLEKKSFAKPLIFDAPRR